MAVFLNAEVISRDVRTNRTSEFRVSYSDFLFRRLTSSDPLCFTHDFVHSRRYPVHKTLVPSVVLRLCVLGELGIDRAVYTIYWHFASVNHNV